jgi:acyl dehydratase
LKGECDSQYRILIVWQPTLCSKYRFKTNIVHGILSASIFSRVLGTEFPGNGSIYTFQELKFLKPIYADDSITVNLKVLSKSGLKYTISTQIISSQGLALDGIAKVVYRYNNSQSL